ncbi:MAG: TIGR04211 family SH3 domain-containing protein [Pseudomonadota bacterium]
MLETKCLTRLLVALAFLPGAAFAETVYVIDKLYVGMRAEAIETSPVIKSVESGTTLEVLQRIEKYVYVRDKQGTNGWVEARYLTADAPARLQMGKLQEDLTKARAQAAEVQMQLKKTEVALAEQTAKRKELEKTVANVPATPFAVAPAPPAPAKGAPTPAVAPPSTATGFSFSFVWLGISFAMLGAGFAAGVAWLRESIRKRSGGMYLRV